MSRTSNASGDSEARPRRLRVRRRRPRRPSASRRVVVVERNRLVAPPAATRSSRSTVGSPARMAPSSRRRRLLRRLQRAEVEVGEADQIRDGATTVDQSPALVGEDEAALAGLTQRSPGTQSIRVCNVAHASRKRRASRASLGVGMDSAQRRRRRLLADPQDPPVGEGDAPDARLAPRLDRAAIGDVVVDGHRTGPPPQALGDLAERGARSQRLQARAGGWRRSLVGGGQPAVAVEGATPCATPSKATWYRGSLRFGDPRVWIVAELHVSSTNLPVNSS